MRYGRLACAVSALALCACTATTTPPVSDVDSLSGASAKPRTEAERSSGRVRNAVDALEALNPSRLTRSSPEVAALLGTHFDECQPHERLSFDTVCHHYSPIAGDDPSPWPTVIIGMRGGSIVSAVLLARDRPLSGWACELLPQPAGTRVCFAAGTTTDDRVLWTQQWSAFFSAAD